MEKTCGNCDYCVEIGLDLVCINPASEYSSDYVESGHSCVDWSGNENEDEYDDEDSDNE